MFLILWNWKRIVRRIKIRKYCVLSWEASFYTHGCSQVSGKPGSAALRTALKTPTRSKKPGQGFGKKYMLTVSLEAVMPDIFSTSF